MSHNVNYCAQREAQDIDAQFKINQFWEPIQVYPLKEIVAGWKVTFLIVATRFYLK